MNQPVNFRAMSLPQNYLFSFKYRHEREIAKVGKGLFYQVPLHALHTASVIEAMYMRERYRISLRAYDGIRWLVEDRFTFPPAYKVADLAKEMRPVVRSFLDGVRCKLSEIVGLTIKEQLTVCQGFVHFGTDITVSFSYGMDGSGN